MGVYYLIPERHGGGQPGDERRMRAWHAAGRDEVAEVELALTPQRDEHLDGLRQRPAGERRP